MSNLEFSSVQGRRLSNASIANSTNLGDAVGVLISMPTADLEWDVYGAASGGQWAEVSASRGRLKIARVPATHGFIHIAGFIEWAQNGTGQRHFGHERTPPSGGVSREMIARGKAASSIPTRQNYHTFTARPVDTLWEPIVDQNSGGALNAQLTYLSFFLLPDYRIVGSPSVTRLRRAATLSVNNADTAFYLSWDTADSNEHGWYSAGTPDTLTFNASLYLHVTAECTFAANTTGDRSMIAEFVDGGVSRTVCGDSTDSASSAQTHTSTLNFLLKVDSGDQLKFPVYQNSGAGLNITKAHCELEILYQI